MRRTTIPEVGIGAATGAAVGVLLGTFVGEVDGTFVGALLGTFVGEVDGTFVGALLGTFVGMLAGAVVGTLVGFVVGILVTGVVIGGEIGVDVVLAAYISTPAIIAWDRVAFIVMVRRLSVTVMGCGTVYMYARRQKPVCFTTSRLSNTNVSSKYTSITRVLFVACCYHVRIEKIDWMYQENGREEEKMVVRVHPFFSLEKTLTQVQAHVHESNESFSRTSSAKCNTTV